ncbi:hypothetical protein LEMLEM_LOCUS10480 [Lemmus lemmus]
MAASLRLASWATAQCPLTAKNTPVSGRNRETSTSGASSAAPALLLLLPSLSSGLLKEEKRHTLVLDKYPLAHNLLWDPPLHLEKKRVGAVGVSFQVLGWSVPAASCPLT